MLSHSNGLLHTSKHCEKLMHGAFRTFFFCFSCKVFIHVPFNKERYIFWKFDFPAFCIISLLSSLFSWFEGILGSTSWAEFPVPSSNHTRYCLYSKIALQQQSPLLRKLYPSEDCLSSRCLTSVIAPELVFPSDISRWYWDHLMCKKKYAHLPTSRPNQLKILILAASVKALN